MSAQSVAHELGHAVPESSQFARLVADKKLGRKTGEGFYKWVDGKAQKGETPAHADLAGLGRELVQPLVDMTEIVVKRGRRGERRSRRYRRHPRHGLCAVPRRADECAQGREGLRWPSCSKSRHRRLGAHSVHARPIPAMPNETNLSMLAAALGGLGGQFGLKGEAVDEVMGGAVISHSRDFNVAREAALDAGYSPRTPGTNLQIACGTSLQAALNLGAKIATGEIESGIACGTDTVSDSPDRVRNEVPASAGRSQPRPHAAGEAGGVQGLLASASWRRWRPRRRSRAPGFPWASIAS